MPGAINKLTQWDTEFFKGHLHVNNAIDAYQRIATKTAIYPGKGSPIGLMYVALKGAGEAGEFAEHVGKAMRDDCLVTYEEGFERDNRGNLMKIFKTRPLTEERKEALIKEVGDQLWYLSAKCNELGITLSHVALVNLQKLQSRSERGMLQGSGDNR